MAKEKLDTSVKPVPKYVHLCNRHVKFERKVVKTFDLELEHFVFGRINITIIVEGTSVYEGRIVLSVVKYNQEYLLEDWM